MAFQMPFGAFEIAFELAFKAFCCDAICCETWRVNDSGNDDPSNPNVVVKHPNTMNELIEMNKSDSR